MRKATHEAIVVMVLAMMLALIANGLRPGGIRLVRSTSQLSEPDILSEDNRVISLKEAILKFNVGRVLFIDARSPEDYAAGHIRGAKNFPAHTMEEWFDEFIVQVEPTQEIITYCHGSDCPLSKELAENLIAVGYENVYHIIDGWGQWRNSNQPIEVGTPSP